METKNMTPLTKGLIIGLILVAYSVIIYIAIPDIKKQQSLNWVSSVLLILAIVWACFTYAKDMNNNVTFGNVFAHGFKTTAVVTSIFVVYTILSVTIIFPEIKDKAMEIAVEKMEERGNLSEAQIDQALEFTKKFFMPLAIGGALIGNLIVGAIAALIGAAVVKKNPAASSPFQSDNLG